MKKYGFFLAFCLFSSISIAQNTYSFKVEVYDQASQDVILIPGFSCSSAVWKSTIDHLGPNYKCHALTLAGFAGHPPVDNYGIEQWVHEIALYIELQKLESPIIIGHSLGGLMAQWLAAEYPHLIGKIIVVDALPCLSALSNPNFKSTSEPDCQYIKSMFMDIDGETYIHNQKMSVAMMTSSEIFGKEILKWGLASDKNTMAEIYCQLMNTDLREKITNIKCPSLVLLEAPFKMMQDPIEKQYANLKNAELAYADKGLHFIMYDDPEWYMEKLIEFTSSSNEQASANEGQ